MSRAAMLRASANALRSLAGGVLRPTRRYLCTEAPPDASTAARDAFLAAIARPKQGGARAKQSAAKRPIDFTKSTVAPKIAEFDLDALLRSTRLTLRKLDLPVQERKRLLKFANKYKQGWIPGKTWRKWRAPPDPPPVTGG